MTCRRGKKTLTNCLAKVITISVQRRGRAALASAPGGGREAGWERRLGASEEHTLKGCFRSYPSALPFSPRHKDIDERATRTILFTRFRSASNTHSRTISPRAGSRVTSGAAGRLGGRRRDASLAEHRGNRLQYLLMPPVTEDRKNSPE